MSTTAMRIYNHFRLRQFHPQIIILSLPLPTKNADAAIALSSQTLGYWLALLDWKEFATMAL
jgi:hypothetical protein